MIAYDLHIHSCLSPCADDDMRPNNIVNMALIKGLEMIAITDHNTTRQLKVAAAVAKDKLKFIYGVEIESIEGVHLLAYFKDDTQLDKVENYLDQHRFSQKNNEDYFGKQILCNDIDEEVGSFDNLLIVACDVSIDEISCFIHSLGGIIVIAHCLGRANSIITQLGFIPREFKFDAIEVKNLDQKLELLKTHPHLKDEFFIYNSDAHRLVDINERINFMDEAKWDRLFGGQL